MAARIASRENRLDSITDVSGLYDEYFSSIRKDIEDLGDSSIVGVAGLVSFFRSVDKTNQEMMRSIETIFGFTNVAFWNYALRLHETEILDLWENEVVRFSDQVLATYIFYLCFFKQRALSFADLLITYFPRYKERLNDSFYPALNTFYSEQFMDVVRKDIDRVWAFFQTAGKTELILSLCESFWFAKETDVLVYLKEVIGDLKSMAPLPLRDEIKADSNIHSPSILSVLKQFNQSDKSNLKIALALIYDYLHKCPADIQKVYYILTEVFGFHYKSSVHDFYVQMTVIETLWQRTREFTDPVLTKLQFLVYRHYLQTRFHTTESADHHAFNIVDFQLMSTPALIELRSKIWKNLFELYNVPDLRRQVLGTLKDYSSSGYTISVDKIVETDSAEIFPFVNSNLSPKSYVDCVLVHSLLDLFESHKISFDQMLRSKFTNKTYELKGILFDDYIERRNLHLEFEEYEKLKHQRIAGYLREFTLVDYMEFFDNCIYIQETIKNGHERYQFQEGVSEVLICLAENDLVLYSTVLQQYLVMGDPLALNPILLVDKLFKALEPAEILAVLTLPEHSSNVAANLAYRVGFWIRRKAPFLTQRKWLFAYYQTLPNGNVTKASAKHIYQLYKKSKRDEPPQHLDYLLKYWEVDQSVFVRITKMILRKSKKDSNFWFLSQPSFQSVLRC